MKFYSAVSLSDITNYICFMCHVGKSVQYYICTYSMFFVCSHLFERDRNNIPNPHELLRIFRFPTSEGREIARAAEKIEQTLNIVRTHVESGMVFNLTGKYFKAIKYILDKTEKIPEPTKMLPFKYIGIA